MLNFIVKVLVNALALWLTTLLYHGVYFQSGGGALDAIVAGLALGLVNALIRPLLVLFSLPLTILTLGLFTLVVNGVVLAIVAGVTSLNVATFGAAIIGALILAVISWGLDSLLHLNRDRADRTQDQARP